ncbi:replicative DNA helicase [Salsipaludibacter albus]|jgi:replicative DNA helicase|uniref:replicative DNA helicase n=1 Tax=Salsipaludibacter albus TaxID=2849650 RepID=UPI001EE42540|nr:replicative DNA helicase [Salsipaludibacter albus]MBY5162402.1 replicative DNA helicase [Salsipaludibacter albus]
MADTETAPAPHARPDTPPVPDEDFDTGAGARRDGPVVARGFDRIPPHSLDAEVSVLGAALLSRSAAIEVSEVLEAEDFYRTAHGTVFAAIVELMSRGEAVDPVTLLDHLAGTSRLDEVGGANAIHDLVSSTPTAANAGHYARIVRDKAMLRRLIDAGTDIVRLGFEPTDDPVASVSEAESIMFRVADDGTRGEATPLKDLLNESFQAIEELAERGDEVTGLPTGFTDLDRLTAGFQPQNLIILAARPAMGKSSLALSIAHYVTSALRKPAAIFSLEMSKQEIVTRLLSSEGMIDSQKLKTGRLDDNDWRRLGDALGALSEAPLYIDDTPSINMMEILAKCRRLKQREGLELVIVDYLQLMQSHRRVDNRQQEVAEISRGLKMMAKELDVPVIALSQLNRSPEARTDKRPMLADLRESGSVEQDADIVGFIYRDEVYNEDSEHKGIAELIIAKHRNGDTRTVRMAFLGHVTKFANLARGSAPAPGGPGPTHGGGPAAGGAPTPV